MNITLHTGSTFRTRKHLVVLLLTFLVSHVNAQVGYHIQNGASALVSFYNNDSIYLSTGATGKSSMMLIDPNTKAWKYLNNNYLGTYGFPVIKDKMNGLIYNASTVQVTTDGWQTIVTPTINLKYVNKSPAGYYGYNNASPSSYSLYFSTNGMNWSTALPANSIMGIRNLGNKVYAIGGSSSSYVSMDGGQTYSTVANTGTFTGNFIGFHMASVDTFLVIMNDKICRSTNGGVTWTNTALPFTFQIASVAIKNVNEFAIITTASNFSYTSNGGNSWTAFATPPPAIAAGTLFYANNYYYVFPYCRTNDFGVTWDQLYPNIPTRAYAVDFNGAKGLIGLQNGKFGYSLDKGRTIKTFTNAINGAQDIMAAKVLSNGNFLAGDRKGQVHVSTDNGATWNKKNTETVFSPNSTRFLTSANENTIVMTRVGGPVASTDGGASFSVVVTSVSGGNHLQALKPNGTMMDLRETNNGWEMRTFDINGNTTVIGTYTFQGSESPGAFYMASDNVGYILTRDNTNKVNRVYRTNDGALNFTAKTDIAQVVTGASAYMNTTLNGTPYMHCFGVDTLIITASFGNYYHVSYDGATTWSLVTPALKPGVDANYGDQIYRMSFFTSGSYFEITGDQFNPRGFYINNASGNAAPVGIKQLNFENKHEALVLFPNPSGSSEQILFSGSNQEAQVTIFDMNGQLVKSMNCTGSFNAEGLNQGLYIVRVKEKGQSWRSAKLIIQ